MISGFSSKPCCRSDPHICRGVCRTLCTVEPGQVARRWRKSSRDVRRSRVDCRPEVTNRSRAAQTERPDKLARISLPEKWADRNKVSSACLSRTAVSGAFEAIGQLRWTGPRTGRSGSNQSRSLPKERILTMKFASLRPRSVSIGNFPIESFKMLRSVFIESSWTMSETTYHATARTEGRCRAICASQFGHRPQIEAKTGWSCSNLISTTLDWGRTAREKEICILSIDCEIITLAVIFINKFSN